MRVQSWTAPDLFRLAGMAVTLVALPSGVRAQDSTPATPAPPPPTAATPASSPAAPAEVTALAEEITVLRAVKPLGATSEQLATLRTAVDAAQERLAQQARTDLQALAALREPVMRARQQLLPLDVNLNDPQLSTALMADEQVTTAQRAAAQNQSRVRDEMTASLAQQLQTLLTTAQAGVIVAQGRALLTAERADQDRQRQQRQQQFQRAMATAGAQNGGPAGRGGGPGGMGAAGGTNGGFGGRGGGPGGRLGSPEGMQRMLERLRGADSDQYQRMASRMARQFGDEGTPGYQNALAMFDQVRNMPDGQFRRQRADLAQRTTSAMTASRSPMNAAYTISPQNALETWIQRYLLSPQAPTALKDLAGAK
jgi:hypothetical protein